MKTTVILMLAGAIAGAVVASFIVPPALAWYSSPGGLPEGAQIQAVVQIPEVIRYATDGLQPAGFPAPPPAGSAPTGILARVTMPGDLTVKE
jgi:hypothetical protein